MYCLLHFSMCGSTGGRKNGQKPQRYLYSKSKARCVIMISTRFSSWLCSSVFAPRAGWKFSPLVGSSSLAVLGGRGSPRGLGGRV